MYSRCQAVQISESVDVRRIRIANVGTPRQAADKAAWRGNSKRGLFVQEGNKVTR
jgi:hypothetical protein